MLEEMPEKKDSSIMTDTDEFSILQEKCLRAECKEKLG